MSEARQKFTVFGGEGGDEGAASVTLERFKLSKQFI